MWITRNKMEFTSRSERARKTWQNPERRIKQTAALKKCWQTEDYRTRLTAHLHQIARKGGQTAAQLRKSGVITVSEETKKRCGEAQRKRFQRPEELKKLEKARSLSFQVVDFQERAKLMHRAFLEKYGSFVELAKMGLRTPKRKPNKLEIEVAKNARI